MSAEVASFWKELYLETGGQIEDHRSLTKSREDLREWAEVILFAEVPPDEQHLHNLDDVADHLLTLV